MSNPVRSFSASSKDVFNRNESNQARLAPQINNSSGGIQQSLSSETSSPNNGSPNATNPITSSTTSKFHSNHTLSRYASSPALTSGSTDPAPGSVGSNGGSSLLAPGYYQSLTPKASFDSITSISSLQSSIGSSGSSGPWSTSTYGSYNIPIGHPQQTSDQSSLSSSGFRGTSMLFNDDYADNLGFAKFPLRKQNENIAKDPNTARQKSLDYATAAASNPDVQGSLGYDHRSALKPLASRSTQNLQIQGKQLQQQQKQSANKANNRSNIDTSMDSSIKNMGRALEEKEQEIAELKVELEAIYTALSLTGTSLNNGRAQKGSASGTARASNYLSSQKMDSLEVAHRMLVRLQTLKDENDHLAVCIRH